MNKNFYRISAVLVVMTMLFLIGVSSASANPFTTNFTGTSTCVDVPGTGEFKVIAGQLHIKGLEDICTDVSDDPRVSGENRIVINAILDLNDNQSGPVWGPVYIENEGGSWVGYWTGKRTSQGFLYVRMSAHGTGGYQGMTAWWDLARLSPDPTYPANTSGTILDPGR